MCKARACACRDVLRHVYRHVHRRVHSQVHRHMHSHAPRYLRILLRCALRSPLLRLRARMCVCAFAFARVRGCAPRQLSSLRSSLPCTASSSMRVRATLMQRDAIPMSTTEKTRHRRAAGRAGVRVRAGGGRTEASTLRGNIMRNAAVCDAMRMEMQRTRVEGKAQPGPARRGGRAEHLNKKSKCTHCAALWAATPAACLAAASSTFFCFASWQALGVMAGRHF